MGVLGTSSGGGAVATPADLRAVVSMLQSHREGVEVPETDSCSDASAGEAAAPKILEMYRYSWDRFFRYL